MKSQTPADTNGLVYRREKSLFTISVIISMFIWFVVIVGTIGIALIYLLFGYIAYLFIQSAFISYLRGTGVKITPEQFPDLHGRLVDCCERLDVPEIPDAYLIHADGAFNALATRFRGRNFVVLYSNVVDALADDPEAINFYLGHELGHLHRKHLVWGPVLWPAGLLPLLGAAYSRAREYTCDAYGAACCPVQTSATNGIAALAAGDDRWRTMNMRAYGAQAAESGRFWMSFHELTGDYPWLTKRLGRLLDGDDYNPPGRHGFAWLLACFVPRLGLGGGGSVLITVAMIGVLAAVAIPAYQDYTIRAKVSGGLALASEAKIAVMTFYLDHEEACSSNAQCGIASPGEFSNDAVRSVSIGEGAVVTVEFSAPTINGESILLEPYLDDNGGLNWACTGGTLAAKYRPSSCRGL